MSIMRPRVDRIHSERFAECQRAVEDGTINIIGDAQGPDGTGMRYYPPPLK